MNDLHFDSRSVRLTWLLAYQRIVGSAILRTVLRSEHDNVVDKQPPYRQLRKTKRLLSDLRRHVTELVVVGFNSGKYDLNVLNDILISYLFNHSGIDLAIKHNHVDLALKATSLKFVDISIFVTEGTSYATFLKAFECQEKGLFPYEYVVSQ